MRRICFIALGIFFLGLFAAAVRAETLELTNGTSITGEIILPGNVDGLNIRLSAGQYQRVPWGSFSQSALTELAKNPRLVQFIEPLLQPSEDQRSKITEVEIKPVARLQRPEKGSLLGALFSTGIGLAALGLLYAANIYAAYQISVIRDQPKLLVCGVSAVLPVIGQIIFLCLPNRQETPDVKSAEDAAAKETIQVEVQSSMADPIAPGPLHLSGVSDVFTEPGIPETQVFQRGKFTFNRRFFETKFTGFFGVVRRDTEKDMLLTVKSARGEYVTHRITRITASEMHLEIRKGSATHEVSVPYTEIQEVQLKHRNAPD